MKLQRLFLPLLLIMPLTGCKYSSSFAATMMSTHNVGNSGSMEFSSFKGRYVFQLKKQNSGEGTISFTGKLKEGYMDVTYVDPFDNQYPLLTLKDGDDISGSNGYIEKGQKIYIIVDAESTCYDGYLSFYLD